MHTMKNYSQITNTFQNFYLVFKSHFPLTALSALYFTWQLSKFIGLSLVVGFCEINFCFP